MQGAADSEKAGVQIPSLQRTCTILSAPGPQTATPGVSGCSAHPSAGPLPPRSFPSRGGRSGRRGVGNLGPLPVRAAQGQASASPAACSVSTGGSGAAAPRMRWVQRGCAATGARAEGHRDRARQPGPQRVPSGERVKRGRRGRTSPARRVAGRGWGGGCGRGRFRAAGAGAGGGRGRAPEVLGR